MLNSTANWNANSVLLLPVYITKQTAPGKAALRKDNRFFLKKNNR